MKKVWLADDPYSMFVHRSKEFRSRVPFVGTVTSGTVSEGTNFMRWVEQASKANISYRLFAICDSLTTAPVLKMAEVVTPNYDELLVSGDAVGRIKGCLEGLIGSEEGKLFSNFLHAYTTWKNRDTKNSFILDIPPELDQASVEQVIREAEQFRAYFESHYGGDISVVSKTATTKGVNSTRLYVRPGRLADGSVLNKGTALEYYLRQNSIDSIKGRIIYFTDKYNSAEEIPLGSLAVIGVEIDPKQEWPALEFGKYGVPALITAPTYLMGAHLISDLFYSITFPPDVRNRILKGK